MRNRIRTALLIVGLTWTAVVIAQEFVVRDRGGEVATVTSNRLDTNSITTGTAGAELATETSLTTAVTHLAAIETAVEDTTPVTVYAQATTSGGCTIGTTTSFIAANTVNETEIKATAGQVYAVDWFHINDAPIYIKFYNDTTANIDETDTPVYRLGMPNNATAASGAAGHHDWPMGIQFSTAITIRVTKGIADNSTTATDASEVLVNVCWK